MSRIPRLWLPGAAAALAAGVDVLALPAEEVAHVRRVLRLRPGSAVRIFDGAGGEWAAELCIDDGGATAVRPGRQLDDEVEAALRVHLIQAACRAERLDWLVQKATELGVASIALVGAARSRPLALDERRLERWRRIAREAAKQSGRRLVPPIEALDRFPPGGGDGPGLLLHGEDARPLGERLREPAPTGGEVRLAVGPEGGWTADEVELARGGGWSPVGLGPRTLRAETAAVAAVSIVLCAWGDLGASRPD